MPHSVAMLYTTYAGMDMGRDNGGVVDLAYEDRAPYAFTGNNYMAELFGGMDDYAVYWQVTHSPEFLELASQVHDFEMTSWLMGIIFTGIEAYRNNIIIPPYFHIQLIDHIRNTA